MGVAYTLDAPKQKNNTCSPSICKCQPAHQILTYSLISLGRIKGVPRYKLGAADLTRRHLADKFLYRATALVNVYQCAKFQLPSSNSFGDMEGFQNKKNGVLIDGWMDGWMDNVDLYSASSLICPDVPYRKHFCLKMPTSAPDFNFLASSLD